MALSEPLPDLEEVLASIGQAGRRLAEMHASEGAAGNISVFIGFPLEVRRRFPLAEPLPLPQPAPALAGKLVIVTGSGRRLRDVRDNPAANLGCVLIDKSGEHGTLYTAPERLFARVTSEFNSHLAVHNDLVARTGTNFHAVVHAQPLHITYLSHMAAYRDELTLNRRLMRWQPETLINLPEGIGVVPFILPGSPALQAASLEKLLHHRIILWSKHGVMARSDMSVTKAADRIEYAETAAHYEYLDLANGGRGEGLSDEEMRELIRAFGVETNLYG